MLGHFFKPHPVYIETDVAALSLHNRSPTNEVTDGLVESAIGLRRKKNTIGKRDR